MRIQVKAGDKTRSLILPTALALNRLTAQLAAGRARSAAKDVGNGIMLSGAQLNRLFGVIKSCKKKHPDWILVEVHGHGGEEVSIKL